MSSTQDENMWKIWCNHSSLTVRKTNEKGNLTIRELEKHNRELKFIRPNESQNLLPSEKMDSYQKQRHKFYPEDSNFHMTNAHWHHRPKLHPTSPLQVCIELCGTNNGIIKIMCM